METIKTTGSETLIRLADSKALLREDREGEIEKEALSEPKEPHSLDEAGISSRPRMLDLDR